MEGSLQRHKIGVVKNVVEEETVTAILELKLTKPRARILPFDPPVQSKKQILCFIKVLLLPFHKQKTMGWKEVK